MLLRSEAEVDGFDKVENLGATGLVRAFLEVVGLAPLSMIVDYMECTGRTSKDRQ